MMDTTDRVKTAAQDGELITIVKHTYVEGDYQTISLTMNDSDLSQFLNLVVVKPNTRLRTYLWDNR